MLNSVKDFSRSKQNGLFINSCFAHCQTERQDTWFSDNSPVVGNKVSEHATSFNVVFVDACYVFLCIYLIHIENMQVIALAVGDWYFDRAGVKVIDCPYPCDNTCHHLVFR